MLDDCVSGKDCQKKPPFFSCLGRRDTHSVKYKKGRGAQCGFGTRYSFFTFKGLATQRNVLGEPEMIESRHIFSISQCLQLSPVLLLVSGTSLQTWRETEGAIP